MSLLNCALYYRLVALSFWSFFLANSLMSIRTLGLEVHLDLCTGHLPYLVYLHMLSHMFVDLCQMKPVCQHHDFHVLIKSWFELCQ
jgi:hypothetical protein